MNRGLRIRVCAAFDGSVHERLLELAEGATAAQAAAASGLSPPGWAGALGIHGVAVQGEQLLRDGDRVEFLLPLQVEPQARRRARAQRRG